MKLVIANQTLERIEGLDSCVNLQELWITECKLKVCVDRQMFRLENVESKRIKEKSEREIDICPTYRAQIKSRLEKAQRSSTMNQRKRAEKRKRMNR